MVQTVTFYTARKLVTSSQSLTFIVFDFKKSLCISANVIVVLLEGMKIDIVVKTNNLPDSMSL
jgi:hypothetical protein